MFRGLWLFGCLLGTTACSGDAGTRTEEIVIADYFIKYPVIQLTCSKPRNSSVVVAVGNPVYHYLSALEDLQAGRADSGEKQYFLAEAPLDSEDCSSLFPETEGLAGKAGEFTQALLIRVDQTFYLLELSLKRKYRLSRLGPIGDDGEPVRIQDRAAPLRVTDVIYDEAMMHVSVQVL